MKRTSPAVRNRALMTVPVAAMMLGASQSQAVTSIGVNFWGAYGSANDPNNGRLVSAEAFGLPAADWSTSYLPPSAAPADWTYDSYITSGTFTAGPLSVDYACGGNWFTGTNPTRSPDLIPGQTDVLNGYIRGGSAGFTVTVGKLATNFPNGYVVQAIAAGGAGSFAPLDVSADGGNTVQTLDYTEVHTTGGYAADTPVQWSIGAASSPLSGDTLTLSGSPDAGGLDSSLAGFIVTDKPVITSAYPMVTSVITGETFTLSGGAIGLGTLSYQWRHNGVNIPNATSSSYTVASGSSADSGTYEVVVTSSAYPASPVTSPAFTVNVSGSEVWNGNNDSSIWDMGTTPNWLRNGAAASYANGLVAQFTDAAAAKTVTLNSAVASSALEFPGDMDYIIAGTGSLSIAGGIRKSGGAHVTLDVPVTLGGTLSIGGGILEFGSHASFANGAYDGNIANAGELVFDGPATRSLGGSISGSGLITKNGAGVVTLAGSGSWYGLTTVNEGLLEVQSKSADNPYMVLAGATLKIGYSTGGGYASTRIDLSGSGVQSVSGLYLKGGTSYNASGGITLNDAPTTIRQYGDGLASLGMFDINGNGVTVTSAASGSVIDSNIQLVQRGYGLSVNIESGLENATGDLVVNGPLNINSHGIGLVKRGDGSLRLNGAATDANEALRIDGGSVITGTGNAIGVNADLGLPNAAATLVLNGTSQMVKKLSGSGRIVGGSATLSTLTVNPNTDANDTVPDTTFGGTLGGTGANENNFGLAKTGPNVLTLSGQGTYSGPTSVLGGTLISRSLSNSSVSVAQGATWLMSGQAASLTVASGGSFSPAGLPAAANQLVRNVITTATGEVTSTITTGDFQELHNSSGTVIPNNTTYTFTGQINLPGPAGTVYYFAENFDDTIVLNIDGMPVLTSNAWNVIGTGSFISPGPGWYPIELRAAQGGGGVGPVEQYNWGAGKGVGFTTTEPADATDGDAYQAFTLRNLNAEGIQLNSDSGQATISGNTKIAGTYLYDITGGGGDKLVVSGNLDLTGATLDINASGTPAGTYVIATWTGTLTGTFATLRDLPAGYSVNYNTTAKQVELVPGGATDYTAWIAGFPVADNTPGGDPDHDGVSNAFEFVLGGNPSVAGDVTLPPAQNVQADVGNGLRDYMKLAFKRQDASLYAAPGLEYSTTLQGGWTSAVHGANGIAIKVTDNVSAGADLVEVYLPRALAAGGRLFARLRATP